ncbi:hypothetical protein M877_40025 (plasmid) [Streptomyces niveus NCIMB 11891]|nr:hypothetical protein M877_40025 [Streptomyces niveus NCIMB 11891]
MTDDERAEMEKKLRETNGNSSGNKSGKRG